jgi:ATP-dependent DNA ligase
VIPVSVRDEAAMRKTAFLPCIPVRGTKIPADPAWPHEIKHDGYRLIVQRDGKRFGSSPATMRDVYG